jgi:hypothetical protein
LSCFSRFVFADKLPHNPSFLTLTLPSRLSHDRIQEDAFSLAAEGLIDLYVGSSIPHLKPREHQSNRQQVVQVTHLAMDILVDDKEM